MYRWVQAVCSARYRSMCPSETVRQTWRAASWKGQTSCRDDGITAVTWSQPALVQQTLTSRSITSEESGKMLKRSGIFIRGEDLQSLLLSQIKQGEILLSTIRGTSGCQYRPQSPHSWRDYSFLHSCQLLGVKDANCPPSENHISVHYILSSKRGAGF